MSGTDRAVTTATDRETGPSADPLIRALESVYLALEGVGLTPTPSPIPVRRLHAALEGFADSASDGSPRLVIEVGATQLETARGPLDARERPELAALGNLLRALEISRVEVGQRLGLAGLERFIDLLDTTRREGRQDAADPAPLKECESVRVTFGTSESPHRPEDPADDAWESLSAAMVPGSINVPLESPAIDLPPRDLPTPELPDPRTADRTTATRERFTRQVARLNPRLRRDLLRISSKGAESTWSALADLGNTLTPSDLLDALQQLDRAGARLTDQTLTLINKLIRLSRSRPSSATEVSAVMDRWGVAPEEEEEEAIDAESHRTVIDVLRRREKLTFNPKPYQSLLDLLSRHDVAPREVASLADYRDPGDLADARVHAGEIAARLLSSQGGDRQRAGLFAYVGAATDALVAQGKFGLIREAAVSARGFGLIETEHERTQRAAQRYLDDFNDPDRISGILEHGCNAAGVDENAASLLVLGGVVALGRIFDKLATHPSAPVVETLRELAADRSLPELRHVIEWRAQRGWKALRPVFPVIGLLRPEDRCTLLEGLFDHPEQRVRRQAIAMADRFDGYRHHMLPYIERELRSDDPAGAATALRVLVKTPGDEAVEALGRFAARDLPAGLHWRRLAERCVTALAERGPLGIERLCAQLDRERRWSRSRLQIAVRIARALQGFRGARRVERSLRQWRRSPAGVLARMLFPAALLETGR